MQCFESAKYSIDVWKHAWKKSRVICRTWPILHRTCWRAVRQYSLGRFSRAVKLAVIFTIVCSLLVISLVSCVRCRSVDNTGIVSVLVSEGHWDRCPPQCPRGLTRRSTAARLLGMWVRIPPGAWMFVCCERCVLSGRSLCYELITRPDESYRLWCVVVCDPETSWMRSHTQSILIELKIGDVSLDVSPTCH
jgi:hypothetical protein